jgi:arsenic resistance protein ArsH
MPNLVAGALAPLDIAALAGPDAPTHAPRILLLYGSLRESSYSRMCAEEGAQVLRALGCETRFFNPSGLPLPDDADADHHKVAELR